MGGGSSKANHFDTFRSSFVGHFVKVDDTKGLLDKCASRSCACLTRVDAAQNKLYLVTEGAVEICVCPVEAGAVRVVKPVEVATLLNSCRTVRPGGMFLWFGDSNPEVVCASSSSSPSKLFSLTTDNWKALAQAPEYKELAEFGNIDFASLLGSTEMFRGFSERELRLMGSVIELHRVFAGDAVTQRGRAGHESAPGFAIFLGGELVEVSEDNNYLFPLSEAALHENKPEKKGRRMSVAPNTTCAEMELQDTAQIEGGFRALRRGEVVGANMCFFPGMVAPSTVVARERSLVGIIRRDALLKLERVLGSPLERRLRPTAVLGMLQEMKKSNALLRVLTPGELSKVAEGCKMQVLGNGQSLLKENDEVHSLFYLESGSLVVSSAASSPPEGSGAAYVAADENSLPDRSYPFSVYSTAAQLAGSATSTSPKLLGPVLSANRKFAFPLASATTPMSSAYTLSAQLPNVVKYGDASKVAVLEIPQKVIDEAVFQAAFEAESTGHISSAVDDVDFIHVLRHSAGFNHLHEYLRNERSTEGIYFWKAVERFGMLMTRFELPTTVNVQPDGAETPGAFAAREAAARLKAAHEITITIIEHYVNSDSFFQVNIPHTHRNAISTTYADLLEKTGKLLETAKSLSPQGDAVVAFVNECNEVFREYGNIFAKAKQEVYLLMREDSFKRWRRTEGFSRFIMDVLNKK